MVSICPVCFILPRKLFSDLSIALLLARSVIRRRRWRAPKSVVERLPVRTYQSTPSTSAPPPPRRTSSLPPRNNRERNVSNASSSRSVSAPSAPEKQNKEYIHQSPPRSGYQGGSVECVVCLEEYVDGVSRVMRLPCGHEFHAGCMCVSLYSILNGPD